MMSLFQNKFNISAMTELREKSRHHNKVQTKQSDDIASLLNLPNMDAYKLWNLTAHQRKSVIKEVGLGCSNVRSCAIFSNNYLCKLIFSKVEIWQRRQYYMPIL